HGIGADAGAVADGDRSQYLGAGADDHAVAEGRVALALLERGAAQGHALIKGHLVADLGRLADHHPHAMVDEEAAADGGAGMDLDAGQDPAEMRQETAGQEPIATPEPVSQAIKDEGVQAGIAKHDLGTRTGRGVPCQNAVNVVAELLEQHWQYYVCVRATERHPGDPDSSRSWRCSVCCIYLVRAP